MTIEKYGVPTGFRPLADFMVPSHEHLERGGYNEETINGRRHYVGRDDKMRAVIGPVRHRVGGMFRKKRGPVPPESAETVRMPFASLAADTQKLFAGFPAPPPPPPSRRRFRDWVTEKFYDDEWHKGIRNTAFDVLMWSFTAASVVMMAKATVWVVF